MDIMQAVKTVLKNYANFNGRSGRAEFWWWMLAYVVAYWAVYLIGGAIGAGNWLATLVALGVIVPSVAVGIRRFHDIGKPALWVILLIIPIVNLIVALLFLTKPSEGPNQYGEGPQAPAA